jgi:protein associated with RNAse G/E
MSSEMVRVVYTKYDGSAHRDYPARRLTEDDLGVWVGVTRGTTSVYHGQPSVEQIPFVLLIPHHAWWTGMFNPPPRTSEVYCDITTPARWEGDTVHIVDLDLDVSRRRDTRVVELRDEDEFAEHRVTFGYPDEVVTQAQSAAQRLFVALGDGSEPFATAYRKWLSAVAD